MCRIFGGSAVVVALALVSVTGAETPPRQVSDGASTEVRLTLSEGTSMAAALSPDGQTIVIDLLGALWTLSSDGGRATRILEDGYDAHAPAWSPDGHRIAFQAYRDSTWNIWMMNRDGSGLRRVTSGPFDDREPHWSPDGLSIAFSSDRNGNYDVWTLTLATSALQPISSGDANEFAPAWSPDGREIAYVSDRRERGVYAATVSSRAERRLQADTRTMAAPSWSLDGQRIAYTAVDGAQSYLMSAGNNVAEPNEDVFPFRPQWTSSGDLLYTADGKIKTRPASGGPARTVEFSADVAFPRAAFTPRRRAFSVARPATGARHHASGGLARRVAHCVFCAGRSVGRGDNGRRRHAGTPHARCLRRHRAGMVARRHTPRVLVRSRRLDGPLDSRPEERRRSQARAARDVGRVVAR